MAYAAVPPPITNRKTERRNPHWHTLFADDGTPPVVVIRVAVSGTAESWKRRWRYEERAKAVPICARAAVPPAVLLAGCIQDGQSLEGTLNSIDCADGQMTVVTDEGKTFVLTIETPDCEAQNLQAGDPVKVTTDEEGQAVEDITVVQKTEVNQTTVVGKVVSVSGDEVAVEKAGGETIVIKIEPSETDVKVGGEDSSVTQIPIDVIVVVKIDQETNVAQEITVEEGQPTPGDVTPSPDGTMEPEPPEEPEPTMDAEPTPTLDSEQPSASPAY